MAARDSREWQQLVEVCRIVDAVLIDQETVHRAAVRNVAKVTQGAFLRVQYCEIVATIAASRNLAQRSMMEPAHGLAERDAMPPECVERPYSVPHRFQDAGLSARSDTSFPPRFARADESRARVSRVVGLNSGAPAEVHVLCARNVDGP